MTYKVIQWATGGVGMWSLRQIIDHPDLELAGVLVFSEDKEGKDAGDLCGRGKTGILATRSKEAIYALDADVVIHCPKLPCDDDVLELLKSGKDVISSVSYFSPMIEGPELMQKIEAACQAGGSTLHGAGIDPGFVCDRVPATLTGICSEVNQIRMIEVFDCSQHPLADMMFNLLGFGKQPENIHLNSPGGVYFSQRLFPAVLDKLARQLGVRLDKIVPGEVEFAFATKDFEIKAGKVRKGTIMGLTFVYTGYVDGKPFLIQQWTHDVGPRDALPKHWPKAPPPEKEGGQPVYQILLEIDGRPSLKTEILITDKEDPVWMGTANSLIRCIPGVYAAPPGFLDDPIFAPWTPRMK